MKRSSLFRPICFCALAVCIAGLWRTVWVQQAQRAPPEVHDDGRFTFAVKMPQAQQVHLFSWELRPFFDGESSFSHVDGGR